MPRNFYDGNRVRYTLTHANSQISSTLPYNWLFLPGGPGCDSSYFQALIDILELPGNVWLIDLPGNGSNTVEENYNFEEWSYIFLEIIAGFENPILVGHSFGGMFPLLFPQLEKMLKALIILNSAPSSPSAESAKYAKLYNLPDISKAMTELHANPSQETFNIALETCLPYYFAPDYLEIGSKALAGLEIQFRPSSWWSKKMENYNALWIPQKVPTLIIGGEYDYITPFTIFEQDQRFKRNNIVLEKIAKSGHFPWIDQPAILKNIYMNFTKELCLKNSPILINECSI